MRVQELRRWPFAARRAPRCRNGREGRRERNADRGSRGYLRGMRDTLECLSDDARPGR